LLKWLLALRCRWTIQSWTSSLGEQALGDRQQAGEVVMDNQQDASEAALDQTAEDIFPLLQILAPEPKENGE
jgi:hypothetical protein